MIILFRKRHLWTLIFCCCTVLGLAAVLWAGYYTLPATSAFAPATHSPVTWVVDPGHGGEDGGAVSPDGVAESHLNLSVSTRVNDLLRFTGQHTIMTRAEDASIHTEGSTIRARKASDIRNRVALVNDTENAILLSIHQNSLPSSPVTHGAQVFWNRQEGGETLARVVQDSLNGCVNAGNEKLPKKIPDTIYLMNHVTVPAVLVECGFLSNTEETRRLQEPSYQTKLAAAITAGCLRCLAGEEVQ